MDLVGGDLLAASSQLKHSFHSPSRCQSTVLLWTNCPDKDQPFQRNYFRSIPGRINRTGDGDWEVNQGELLLPGIYQ